MSSLMTDNKSVYATTGGSTSAAVFTNDQANFDEMNISVSEYLAKFQPALLHQLYASTSVCLAVFRELSSFAQNFVLRLVFIDQPITQAVVSSWVKSPS